MGIQAQAASKVLAQLSTDRKNMLLEDLAAQLLTSQEKILKANLIDIENSQRAGKNAAFIDRLKLSPGRIENMASGLRNIISLPDPIGASFDSKTLPNGLQLSKRRVPIGVIAVIYESRPNVTIDVAGLGIKTGNAIILRGGSDTIHSNQAIVSIIHEVTKKHESSCQHHSIHRRYRSTKSPRTPKAAPICRYANPSRLCHAAYLLQGKQPHPRHHRWYRCLSFIC